MQTNMNNNITKYFIYFFNIILGSFIILYTFYRRVLLVHLPKDLWFINNKIVDYNLLIFLLISIIICGYILYKNLLILINKQLPENIFHRILFKLNQMIDDALYHVYSSLGNLFTDPYDKISLISEKFYKYFKNIPEFIFLFILYFIRLAILACFLIDIFKFFRLEYIYNALYLLCFSLGIKILFYIIRDFSKNLEEAKSILIIEEKGLDSASGLPLTHYSLKKEYDHLDLKYHVGQFILCSKISGYLNTYDRYATFFDPFFNSFLYLVYTIGWFFVIVKNLNFLL